jgi:hypothetical protein
MEIAYRIVLLGLAAWLAVSSGGACNDSCTGYERCNCFPNKTCNGALVCLSDVCVSGSAAGASGGAGTMGSGGTTGTAGVTGGAGTTGAGGTTGSAGTTGGAGTGGGNLIKNGDYSQGKTYWDLTYQAGEVGGSDFANGEYCVLNLSMSMYLSFSLGYPPTPSDAFVIEPGGSYTLTYRARFQAGAAGGALLPKVTAKIGHASPPYTGLVMFTGDSIVTNYSTFTHPFSGGVGDTGAGLVFNGTLDYFSEVCFDDVKLVKN